MRIVQEHQLRPTQLRILYELRQWESDIASNPDPMGTVGIILKLNTATHPIGTTTLLGFWIGERSDVQARGDHPRNITLIADQNSIADGSRVGCSTSHTRMRQAVQNYVQFNKYSVSTVGRRIFAWGNANDHSMVMPQIHFGHLTDILSQRGIPPNHKQICCVIVDQVTFTQHQNPELVAKSLSVIASGFDALYMNTPGIQPLLIIVASVPHEMAVPVHEQLIQTCDEFTMRLFDMLPIQM